MTKPKYHFAIHPRMDDRTFEMYMRKVKRLIAPAYQTKRPTFTDSENNPLQANEQERRWEMVKPVGSNA